MPDPASPQGHGPGENPSGPGGVSPGVAKLSDLPGIHTPPTPCVLREAAVPPPQIPDHELLRVIGGGSYGQVWLGRNAVGTLRAIKVVHLQRFEDRRHFDREFKGLQKFEPVSRAHEGLVDILQLGRNDAAGYFYYVMELADASQTPPVERQNELRVEGYPKATAFSQLSTQESLNSYTPRTLRSELSQRGPLPLDECIQIGLAMASALAHLHQHGLVHRDVKPSNVIVVNGQPKLADIGLVTEVSDAHSMVGTVGFIPPEGPGTPQADLYSLGKVLYELSTGKDRQQFPQLPLEVEHLPDHDRWLELNEVILRACESDPQRRYQTAEAMHADLSRLRQGKSVRRQRTWERARTLARRVLLGAAALALATLLLPRLMRQGTPQSSVASAKAAVFVLPFRSHRTNEVGTDLCSRITDAFIDSLALIDGVRRSPRKSGWRYQDEDEVRHALARTNDMRHILTGRIASSNDALTLTLRLYERRKDQPLWTETFSGKTNEVVALERSALDQLTGRLGLKISSEEHRRIDQLLTNNLEALRWYQQAVAVYSRKAGTQTGYKEVRELAQKALALDPLYLDADAFDAYMIRNVAQDRSPVDTWPEVRVRMEAILGKDDTHALALDQLVGYKMVWDRDWAGAFALCNRSLQALSQQDRLWLRAFYDRTYGWFKEARADQEQSEHPEPTNPDQRFSMASSRWVEGRYAEGAQVARRTLELYPGHAEGYYWLAHCLVADGQYDEGLQAVEKAQEAWKKQEMTALKGFAYARMGQPDKAREVLEELLQLERTGPYLQPYFVARVYAALGEKDKALDWLEKAEVDRSEYLVLGDFGGGLRTDLAWDDLKDEPRFKELLKKVGLDQWPRPKPTP